MTEYGPAFYGSDEINKVLEGEIGAHYSPIFGAWKHNVQPSFKGRADVYKFHASHWFYDTDEFKRAKKLFTVTVNPLIDYSLDELQAELETIKAAIAAGMELQKGREA